MADVWWVDAIGGDSSNDSLSSSELRRWLFRCESRVNIDEMKFRCSNSCEYLISVFFEIESRSCVLLGQWYNPKASWPIVGLAAIRLTILGGRPLFVARYWPVSRLDDFKRTLLKMTVPIMSRFAEEAATSQVKIGRSMGKVKWSVGV